MSIPATNRQVFTASCLAQGYRDPVRLSHGSTWLWVRWTWPCYAGGCSKRGSPGFAVDIKLYLR